MSLKDKLQILLGEDLNTLSKDELKELDMTILNLNSIIEKLNRYTLDIENSKEAIVKNKKAILDMTKEESKKNG